MSVHRAGEPMVPVDPQHPPLEVTLRAAAPAAPVVVAADQPPLQWDFLGRKQYCKKTSSSKTKSRSYKAGLKFPVGRIHRILRKSHIAARVGTSASVFLAGVLEYLVAEIVEMAGTAAGDGNRHRILPRHVMLAVRNDNEMNQIMKRITMSHVGVIPRIQPELMRKNFNNKKIKV